MTAEGGTRPCLHCGRSVPQRGSAGRPFRYCRDNDGECQRAARTARMRHRSAPGLAGQVAKAFEVVDRLEQVAETLADALHDELSPAGVERQLAEVRAQAATEVAAARGEVTAAHAERDEALRVRQETETALSAASREVESARSAVTAAESAAAAAMAAA